LPFHQRPAEEEGHRATGELLQPEPGLEVTVGMLDRIKELGFQYATRSGLSSAWTTW